MKKMIHATLCFLMRDAPDKMILLGMKKRGFGTGKWNGFGGKIAENETIEQAAIREVYEEMGVEIPAHEIEKFAELTFLSIPTAENKQFDMLVHVFVIKNWKGDPEETEEMLPKWFAVNKLPFESMWADDPHWLPLVINGKKLKARFTFGKDTDIILNKQIELVEKL